MFGLSGRQVFILLVLFVSVYAAVQYVPAYFAAYQFNDFIRQEVKFAVAARKTTQTVRDEIAREAKYLDIPFDLRDVTFTRRGPSFTVDVEYRWPIDMRLYKHVLVFHTTESGEIFENASN
jgi:hypothetical protein